jgi:hypothetical protein
VLKIYSTIQTLVPQWFKFFAKEQEILCPKGASFSATAASVAFWALLKVRLNRSSHKNFKYKNSMKATDENRWTVLAH